MPSPSDEDTEVIVKARIRINRPSDSSSDFSLANWFYLQQYGPGTQRPAPFEVVLDQTLSPSEMVARTCDSIALAIETLTNLARPVLPRAEARRLDALTNALRAAAKALALGEIDLSTAKNLVRSSLAVAFDTMTGAALGVLFGAFGSWVTTFAPTPLSKALSIAGFGIFGLVTEWYIASTNASNVIAAKITDALFNGIEALTNAINSVIQSIYNAMDDLFRYPHLRNGSLDLQASPTNIEGQELLAVRLYHDGIAEILAADAAKVVVVPEDFSTQRNPKSPWNDDEPIG